MDEVIGICRQTGSSEEQPVYAKKRKESDWWLITDLREYEEEGDTPKTDFIAENYSNCYVMEPRSFFEKSIIGVVKTPDAHIVIYDTYTTIEAFIEDGYSDDDAWDHFGYNVIGGWVGDEGWAFLFDSEDIL